MCGFVGILHYDRIGDAPQRVQSMADSIIHRGPDDEGYWSDRNIALGFRRLSIVDIETGAQPMSDSDGRVWVVFNGEIYNHRELRKELEARGHRFATDHSDTEVLVHGWLEWGERLPERLNGMFAFAIWDCEKRSLFAARDRLGIKPFYMATLGNNFIFGSEIRAIHASGLVPKQENATGVLEYFQQQNLWNGRSMFNNVEMIEPATFLKVDASGIRRGTFWEFGFDRRESDVAAAAHSLRGGLTAAMDRQMAADVPVMTYLSGGIDSSAITARAHQIDETVRSYSCLFDLESVGADKIVDEREFSRAIAQELGNEHIELMLPQDDLTNALAPTISALEEPRMGMAYVNYRIAERVARDSKVVLSGCGGDEMLGGYVARYGYVQDEATTLPQQSWPKRILAQLTGRSQADSDIRKPLHVLYGFLVTENMLSEAFTASFLAAAGHYSMTESLESLLQKCPSTDPWDQLMYLDAKTYLHGLLVVEDKLSMAHSLETRVPLLDNEIMDLATTYQWPTLTDGITGKMAFREAIRDWVPALVADKPKMGFGPPDASWYRGRLQPFVRQMLSSTRIAERGVFEPAFVSRIVEEHMAGTANRVAFIWSFLSFEAWCEEHGLYGGVLR